MDDSEGHDRIGIPVPGLNEILAAKKQLSAAIDKAEKEEEGEEESYAFSPQRFSFPFADSDLERGNTRINDMEERRSEDEFFSETEESPLLLLNRDFVPLANSTPIFLRSYRAEIHETPKRLQEIPEKLDLDQRNVSQSPSIDIQQESLTPSEQALWVRSPDYSEDTNQTIPDSLGIIHILRHNRHNV